MSSRYRFFVFRIRKSYSDSPRHPDEGSHHETREGQKPVFTLTGNKSPPNDRRGGRKIARRSSTPPSICWVRIPVCLPVRLHKDPAGIDFKGPRNDPARDNLPDCALSGTAKDDRARLPCYSASSRIHHRPVSEVFRSKMWIVVPSMQSRSLGIPDWRS